MDYVGEGKDLISTVGLQSMIALTLTFLKICVTPATPAILFKYLRDACGPLRMGGPQVTASGTQISICPEEETQSDSEEAPSKKRPHTENM